MRAIEDVGMLTAIATDKTGTLTQNKLTVQQVWRPEGTDTAEASLARQVLMTVNSGGSKMHDPLDSAMHDYGKGQSKIPPGYKLVVSLPFDQLLAMSGNVWSHGGSYEVMLKGAPEHVLSRCRLGKPQAGAAREALHSLTGQGFRVIALATAEVPKPIQSLEELPASGLDFGGFLAVADILRPEAKAAVATAHQAGINVIMVTGDHYETAFSIGRQLGMVERRDQVFDSREMDRLSDAKLAKSVQSVRVFSRVVPESKYRLLSILKKREIIAMTGDGVNDVPALTKAHVGIAMGAGSQIAREAGDIVLLDNNFKSIVEAVREGRVIVSNIRKMLFYELSSSAGEVLTMIGALLVGLPLPVAAVQILWINLVTDTSLVIPLGLEPAEEDVMKSKPRHPEAPILDRFIIVRIVLVALTMAGTTLITFFIFLQFTSVEYARTIAFSVLVVSQWANAYNARSEIHSVFSRVRAVNGKFYIGLSIAVVLQLLAMFGPLQQVLHVTPVALPHLALTSLVAIVALILVCELHKYFYRRGAERS